MAVRREYKLASVLTPESTAGGPINCLLFIKDATLLISGGDDQILRMWDVQADECIQELRDHQWGQITALSWLPEQLDKAPALFIGTGRGVVSAYPFSNERTQVLSLFFRPPPSGFHSIVKFIRQASATTAAFILDDSVEVQTLDSRRSKFAVASHSGRIRMYDIKDTTTLIPLWTFQVQDIPRSIFFLGEQSERLVLHTCYLGHVVSCNSDTGDLIGTVGLVGGIGSAVLASDRSMKAVHNLSSGDFDVYTPADSLVPISLSVPSKTRFIKQCIFAGEDGRTLVCGGDDATIHTFSLGETPQRQSLVTKGSTGFYAVTAFSTIDYHFIACGQSEEPGTIFVWRKPTQKRAAEDKKFRRLQADKEHAATQAAEKEMEAKALKQKLSNMRKLYEHRTLEHTSIAVKEKCLILSILVLLTFTILAPCAVWVAYRNDLLGRLSR